MAYYYPFFNISICISIFTLATQHALYIHKRIVFIPMSLFCTDTRRVIMTLSKDCFHTKVGFDPDVETKRLFVGIAALFQRVTESFRVLAESTDSFMEPTRNHSTLSWSHCTLSINSF